MKFSNCFWKRRDYAGRLPKENNYGDFPAFTAAWKISNEKFFPKSDRFNLLKLRASWGRVGNLGSIGYNYKAAILSKKENPSNEGGQYGTTVGGAWGTAIYKGDALNRHLTWETSEQTDFGMDIDLLFNIEEIIDSNGVFKHEADKNYYFTVTTLDDDLRETQISEPIKHISSSNFNAKFFVNSDPASFSRSTPSPTCTLMLRCSCC